MTTVTPPQRDARRRRLLPRSRHRDHAPRGRGPRRRRGRGAYASSASAGWSSAFPHRARTCSPARKPRRPISTCASTSGSSTFRGGSATMAARR